MKRRYISAGLTFIVFIVLKGCLKKDDFPILKGSYLGQKPPDMTPEVFAPDILNTEEMGAFCSVFSPDGDEFFFVYYQRAVEKSGFLSMMVRKDNVWSKPQALPFSIKASDNDMCLSTDGKRMIFRSWRALPDGSRPDNHSWLWFVERTNEGWSDAKPLLCGGQPVRTGYPSMAEDGTLYFIHRKNNILGIYQSDYMDGNYSTPKFVYTVIDTHMIHGDMFIAPDESYMIVSCRDPENKIGYGQLDLYIVFQKVDGTWTDAVNMGPDINTKNGENCPQISPDGKYFFYNSYNPVIRQGNTYWVDARIIETYKTDNTN